MIRNRTPASLLALALAPSLVGCAGAPPPPAAAPTPVTAAPVKTAYPSMAPAAAYRGASAEDEARLARSAAPASVSDHADVLVLGDRGYAPAAKGTNGFVCVVARSWAASLDDPGFWNPKVRAPICFNAAAARSVLTTYLHRTEWALAGVALPEIVERTKAAVASKEIEAPAIGSMCFMMSKAGYLSDDDGHWHPHLMFFLPRTPTSAADWGANVEGSPLFAADSAIVPATTYLVPVRKWSDGTADATPH